MKYTKKDYEEYLNRMLADSESFESARERFGYMFVNENSVDNYYHNHMLGALIRKKDVTMFNVGFNDYVQSKGFTKG